MLSDRDQLQQYLDGTLGVEALAQLEQRLKSEPALADELIRMSRQEAVLAEWAAGVQQSERPSNQRITTAAASAVTRSHRPAPSPRRNILRADGRRRREETNVTLAAVIAASVLLALVGLIALSGSPSLPRPPVREAKKTERPADRYTRELVESQEAARRAREAYERAETERTFAAQKLKALELERARLAEEERKSREESLAAEIREQRRQKLEEADQELRRQAEELAKKEDEGRRAAEAAAVAARERQEKERQAAEVAGRKEEIGQVVFVANAATGAAPRPVLVRDDEGKATRTPLANGMTLRVGDRIETGAAAANVPEGAYRPVHAAVEVWNSATLDLADSTTLELAGPSEAAMPEGLLYAELVTESPGAARNAWSIKSRDAKAEPRQGTFDFRADGADTILQVEDGATIYSSPIAANATEIKRLQRSVARKNSAPSAPATVQASAIWRGRKGPSAPGNPVAKPPPAAAALPLPVQGLRFYVRADAGVVRDGNNRVQRWNNQMGSGKDAAQSTAAAQPLWVDKAVNGKPALRFTGTEFLKTTFVPATGATPRTGIAVLANMPSKPGQWSLAFHYGDTQDDECYGMNAGSGGFGNYYFGSGLGSSQKPGAAPVIVTVRYDGTDDRVYVNGVEKGAKQIALKTGSGGMRIGCKVTDGVYPYKGDIAEILIYDRALSDAERLAVEVYLNAKYSVYDAAPAEK